MTTEAKNCNVAALQVAELTREDLEASDEPEERHRFARKLLQEAEPLAHCPAGPIAEEAKALVEIAERELEAVEHRIANEG